MVDILTKKERSYCMSRIRGSKTSPELKIRKIMKLLGFSYQPKGIYGKPDYANKKEKIIIFIDGCYWHKCSKHFIQPKTNKKFWMDKINKNVLRDRQVNKKLKKEGWRIIRVWEHDLKQLK